jgi:hypothetical protein
VKFERNHLTILCRRWDGGGSEGAVLLKVWAS